MCVLYERERHRERELSRLPVLSHTKETSVFDTLYPTAKGSGGRDRETFICLDLIYNDKLVLFKA